VLARLCEQPWGLMLRVSWGIFHLAVGSAQTSKTREKVKVLLKDNPNLVFSKDNNGDTPLHAALHRAGAD